MRLQSYASGRWAYRCDACGLVSPWQESWVWYGSYLEAEAGTALTYCGSACAGDGARKRIHPRPPREVTP